MIEYSHQNSLTFGYNGGVLNEKTPGAELRYHFNRCSRRVLSFPKECEAVAELLAEKAERLGRPLYLLQSGGLDSEVMILSFIKAGVKFKTASFRFSAGLNSHEVQNICRFNEQHSLDHIFLDINPLTWYQTESARKLYFDSFCTEPIMIPHMKLLSHIWKDLGGMPVMGGGDVVVLNTDGQWRYSKFEYMLPWYWHARKNDIDAAVAFFQHVPEITYSMLMEPEIYQVITGEDAVGHRVLRDVRQQKYEVYHRYWPALQRRPKFAGHELILPMILQIRRSWLAQRALRYDETWSTPVHSFLSDISPP